jgi:predicted RNA binding protein YcfA (HicA-like mRNA interferase family)
MSVYPAYTGDQLIKALQRHGFEIVRNKGSHHRLRHPDGRATTVPVHSGEIIGLGLLARILNDYDLTMDDIHPSV